MNAAEAQAVSDLLERHSGLIAALVARVESLVRAFAPPDVLFEGRVLIPAAGFVEKGFRIPAQAVALEGGASPATVAAGPPQGAAPTSGVGVHQLAPGQGKVGALAGTSLTIYGTPGDTVGLAVYATQLPPQFGTTGIPAATTGTTSRVASANADTTLLGANPARKTATVVNESTANLFLLLSGGAAASATNYTVKLAAGAAFSFPAPVYTGVVHGFWDAANGFAQITEFS